MLSFIQIRHQRLNVSFGYNVGRILLKSFHFAYYVVPDVTHVTLFPVGNHMRVLAEFPFQK